MLKLWIFLGGGGHHKTRLFWGAISIHFRAFSYSQGTDFGFFSGVANLKYSLGVCMIFLIFLCVCKQ